MRKFKKILILLIIFLAFSVIFFIVRLKKLSNEYADGYLSNEITAKIYSICERKYSEKSESINKAIEKSYDSSGKITSIHINSAVLNSIASEVVSDVVTYMNSASADMGIYLGNISGITLLSGKGYKIPISLVGKGSISGGIISEFTESGINQTKHRITLEIRGLVGIMSPITTKKAEINVSFLLSEIIIIGDIPYFFSE